MHDLSQRSGKTIAQLKPAKSCQQDGFFRDVEFGVNLGVEKISGLGESEFRSSGEALLELITVESLRAIRNIVE